VSDLGEASVSAQPQLIGARLGAYEIEALLGTGGMAKVYRGLDTNLQRAVAIKVLSPTAAAQPGFADRVRQEARLIANLRHPNIVQVYDFGQLENYTYMVQELLAGPTLEAWMRDLAAQGTRPTPEQIRTIVSHLAGALDAAHAAGIIHRDVKPGNALWNEGGRLVLTDFGIAKQILSDMTQTQFGIVFGTPSYLSPEQAQGLPLTPACDVYSLGVVLYELIAGDVPFRGTTPMQVAMEHIQMLPPPLPSRPELSPLVEAVVRRALAKDPAARYGSAGELAQALDRAWAVAPASTGMPAAPDIHNQVTRVWQPSVPANSPASSAAPRTPATPPTALQQSRSQPPGARLLLAVLVALLAIMLLGGGVLAARGSARTTPPAVAGATVAALPTMPPAQLSTPPSEKPTVLADTFAQLRALLEAGRADGRAGGHGDALLAALDGAQQALASGDTKIAVQRFSTLQQILLAGTHERTIDAGFMADTMKRVQTLATSYNLKLPLSVQFN
jgi:serine/threonine-protein kinase